VRSPLPIEIDAGDWLLVTRLDRGEPVREITRSHRHDNGRCLYCVARSAFGKTVLCISRCPCSRRYRACGL
jgi:hypothetical protein